MSLDQRAWNAETMAMTVGPTTTLAPTSPLAAMENKLILGLFPPLTADNFVAAFTGGDNKSWRGHSREQWVVGGNNHLVGTPEQIVEWFARLHDAGRDGVQVNFFDDLPDPRPFGECVVPLMVEAGPRKPGV